MVEIDVAVVEEMLGSRGLGQEWLRPAIATSGSQ
jgi:hypothetical protein